MKSKLALHMLIRNAVMKGKKNNLEVNGYKSHQQCLELINSPISQGSVVSAEK